MAPKKAYLRTYAFKILPNVKEEFGLRGNNLRVVTSPVTLYFEARDSSSAFYLEAGEQINFTDDIFEQFDIFHLSGAEVSIVLAVGEGAQMNSAKISGIISGTVALDAATLAALESINVQNTVQIVSQGQQYSASYRANSNAAANTAITIFSPASNVNGAIVHSAMFHSQSTGYTDCAYLAKSSAPVNVSDGDAILGADGAFILSTSYSLVGSLKNPIRVPAGKGLYFISALAEGGSSRSVLYTLL